MAHDHEIPAPARSPCPECSGERVVAQGNGYISLVRPGGFSPRLSGEMSGLWALVCTRCGATTFYAKDPSKLYI